MIEQVLYRRTEQGYSEYRSKGLSMNNARSVNLVMDQIASNINDLSTGADAPFLIYPFETIQRYCLAIFRIEYSQGRRNSVNHGLLIEDDEYRKLVRNPEQIWGFSNKNFLSRSTNHRKEMLTLKTLNVSINAELSKDWIFKEYGLDNAGYLKFLNAVNTSLSKKKNYTFGIRIDQSKDANKVMRHFGYLIMSMLPYELRDQISFCSRKAPKNIRVTIQILRGGDPNDTDVIYEVNTGECKIKKTSIEIENGYLNDMLNMSDDALKKYFAILDEFKGNLNLSAKSGGGLVVSKLMILSNNPSLFASETVKAQVAFIHDVFSLPTSNTELINSIVVQLLPHIDSKHYMEAFKIGFELYKKLNSGKSSDAEMMHKIKDNLIGNYKAASVEEKKALFLSVSEYDEKQIHSSPVLEGLIQVNDTEIDVRLIDEYIKIYELFFNELMDSLLIRRLNSKICNVFKNSGIDEKKRVWKLLYDAADSKAKKTLIYYILSDKDELFQKEIFSALIGLYAKTDNEQVKERCYTRIKEVILEEDDDFRVCALCTDKNQTELEDSLWCVIFNAINHYQTAAENVEFMKCFREKYLHSANSEICDLYLGFLSYIPFSEIERIILWYEKQKSKNKRADDLINEVICLLQLNPRKVSVEALKVLVKIVKDQDLDGLASYIYTYYLSNSSDTSIEVYEFLERNRLQLYNNVNLNKESLRSFDYYCAEKLNQGLLKKDRDLLPTLRYIEKLQYHDKSYEKINRMYQKWIAQEVEGTGTDYERYQKCRTLYRKLNSISETGFGKQYCQSLKAQVKDGFWRISDSGTFDYDHCEIYQSNSEMYSQKYRDHENHELAETVGKFIQNTDVNWDEVYKTLLSKDCISHDNVRNRIISKFENDYKNRGLSKRDINYIAFMSVDKNNLRMNYTKLFEGLQKYNYDIDENTIRGMKIFNDYIEISDELRRKLVEHKNFYSDSPSYYEVFRGLFIEQIIALLLLIANNIVRFFAIDMYENLKIREVLLMCNYIGYIFLIVGVAVVSILLMNRAKMRKSQKYDKYIYSLLVLNMFLSIVAILLSAIFEAWYICLPITIVAMAIAIFLNYLVRNMIGEQKKSHRMRR